MKALLNTLLATLILLFAGCSGVQVSDYQQMNPKLNLYDYFTGQTRGWGIVLDRSGALMRSFNVDIAGTVSPDGRLVLDEHFLWNDGEKSRRVWTITEQAPLSYTGTAADVSGTAEGMAAGNALNWQYTMMIDTGDSSWNIRFDDWMFLLDDQVVINRAEMSKFGLKVGEVIITFNKI
jgi:hypothetical protein